MGQLNLKLSENLHEAAKKYARAFGFRNVQELAAESMREKIFEKNEFDNDVSDQEILIVDELIETGLKEGNLGSEAELNDLLSK